MYPGIPNTTHMSQETDQQYGAFKTQFSINLDTIVEGRINSGVSLSLQPELVGLPLFGGVDNETGVHVTRSAFKVGISKAKCLCMWEKVGAVMANEVTRACLLISRYCSRSTTMRTSAWCIIFCRRPTTIQSMLCCGQATMHNSYRQCTRQRQRKIWQSWSRTYVSDSWR
jgi:hypothetical protein